MARPRHAASRVLVGLLGAAALLALIAAPAGASFKRVPGTNERSGPGDLYRYTVEVERRLPVDRRGFAAEVQRTLFDDRGWGRRGAVAFKHVDRGGNTRVMLASPRTVDRLCYPLATKRKYSCSVGDKVVLNYRRWKKGVSHWPSTRRNYRRMLVNHEMGHRLGQGHRSCRRAGRRAPVMQQQTIGLQGCRANWWPLRKELRSVSSAAASASGASVATAE